MAVTVFVWLPRDKNVGHASMSGRGFYVSWWPSPGPGPDGSDGFYFTGMRGMHHTLTQDVKAEGRNPDYASPPIEGLDEDKIAAFWNQVRCRRPNDASLLEGEQKAVCKPEEYAVFANNCSAMVVRALGAGGAWANPKFMLVVSTQAVITPNVVRDCAEVLSGAWLPAVANASPYVNVFRTLYQQLAY